MIGRLCNIAGCERFTRTRGMCKRHYALWYRSNGARVCSVKDCAAVAEVRDLCLKHYSRWYKYGDPLVVKYRPIGSSGGISTSGYRLLKGTLEHVQIAEKAIGHSMPRKAQVHHVDYDKLNNANANLVICPSLGYHRLLHLRTDALLTCGNANWRRCKFCKEYDDPARMYAYPGGNMFHHRACVNAYNLSRTAKAAAAA